jgi:ubiquinol-cytochrome c reductase cytochrome c subunit
MCALAALLSAAPAAAQPQLEHGRELYAEGCISCHGLDGRGRPGTAPSLREAGAVSADLYLTTGYMPLDDPRQTPKPRQPLYTPQEIDALVAYVDSLGDGPPIPDVRPERGDLAEGREAFTTYCAGCHQVVARGGVVLDGVAPPLVHSTPTQIGEAIRVGPYLMPRFGESEISDATIDSIARYVEYARQPRDDGGWGIGHVGPIPEGFIAWIVAGVALVAVARTIGKRIA